MVDAQLENSNGSNGTTVPRHGGIVDTAKANF